jgi:alpha-N-arabinofuranosidase
MSHCEAPEKQIRQAIDLLDQNGVADRIRIAFDEWNLRGWHHPGFPGGGGDRLDLIRERDENDLNQTYTMADAVFSASFLNSCLRNAAHVQMACMAPVVNVRGPLYVHPKGIVKRTTFHVLRMYSDLLEDNVLDGSATSDPLDTGSGVVPALDAVTTCSSDRKRFALALINRDPERTAQWQVNLRGFDSRQELRITVLSGKSTDSFNDVEHPNQVVPEKVSHQTAGSPLLSPPHSVSVVQFSV